MSRKIPPFAICILIFLFGPARGAVRLPAADKMQPINRDHLCVTEGSISETPNHRLSVTVPKMRAYATVPTSQNVTAHFTYLGSTGGPEARLGSGELRRQFGLKLRAEDACNLVYAMWRIEPESKLVISVKSNPGQHTSAACGNRGYRNIKPRHASPIPVLRSGDTHTLRAQMNGEAVKVFIDNNLVWEGEVGPQAYSFVGPVGMRSDNARLELELLAPQAEQNSSAKQLACRAGESE